MLPYGLRSFSVGRHKSTGRSVVNNRPRPTDIDRPRTLNWSRFCRIFLAHQNGFLREIWSRRKLKDVVFKDFFTWNRNFIILFKTRRIDFTKFLHFLWNVLALLEFFSPQIELQSTKFLFYEIQTKTWPTKTHKKWNVNRNGFAQVHDWCLLETEFEYVFRF